MTKYAYRSFADAFVADALRAGATVPSFLLNWNRDGSFEVKEPVVMSARDLDLDLGSRHHDDGGEGEYEDAVFPFVPFHPGTTEPMTFSL